MTGTGPRARETGLMDTITYVGLDVHKLPLRRPGRRSASRLPRVPRRRASPTRGFRKRPEILMKLAEAKSVSRRRLERRGRPRKHVKHPTTLATAGRSRITRVAAPQAPHRRRPRRPGDQWRQRPVCLRTPQLSAVRHPRHDHPDAAADRQSLGRSRRQRDRVMAGDHRGADRRRLHTHSGGRGRLRAR